MDPMYSWLIAIIGVSCIGAYAAYIGIKQEREDKAQKQ